MEIKFFYFFDVGYSNFKRGLSITISNQKLVNRLEKLDENFNKFKFCMGK